MLQPQVLESEDLLGCHLALQNSLKGAMLVQAIGGGILAQQVGSVPQCNCFQHRVGSFLPCSAYFQMALSKYPRVPAHRDTMISAVVIGTNLGENLWLFVGRCASLLMLLFVVTKMSCKSQGQTSPNLDSWPCSCSLMTSGAALESSFSTS